MLVAVQACTRNNPGKAVAAVPGPGIWVNQIESGKPALPAGIYIIQFRKGRELH